MAITSQPIKTQLGFDLLGQLSNHVLPAFHSAPIILFYVTETRQGSYLDVVFFM